MSVNQVEENTVTKTKQNKKIKKTEIDKMKEKIYTTVGLRYRFKVNCKFLVKMLVSSHLNFHLMLQFQ